MTDQTLVAAPVFSARSERAGMPLAVMVVGTDAATVEDALERLKQLLTAFDPTVASGELARANARAGQLTNSSLETALLASVVQLADNPVDVRLDRPAIRVTSGTRLDPGRIGVALALDMVVHDLEQLGAAAAAVRAGVDMRVTGAAPYANGWQQPDGVRWLRDRSIVTYPSNVLRELLQASSFPT